MRRGLGQEGNLKPASIDQAWGNRNGNKARRKIDLIGLGWLDMRPEETVIVKVILEFRTLPHCSLIHCQQMSGVRGTIWGERAAYYDLEVTFLIWGQMPGRRQRAQESDRYLRSKTCFSLGWIPAQLWWSVVFWGESVGEAEIRLVMKQTFISTSCFKYYDCGDTLGMSWKA